jgi:hypothetical protein
MKMSTTTTTKYSFRIRTRQGLVVENLMIHGRDEADAERKLRQMYLHCEILDRNVMHPAMMQPSMQPPGTTDTASFEEIVSLISK